ncbi:MAG TPA: M15 family metallopeptidase [Candidatus Saccharimonadales bacterium]|nr:M15 family metallopeptidase [Candidatus Saccharimonadales bacterium]
MQPRRPQPGSQKRPLYRDPRYTQRQPLGMEPISPRSARFKRMTRKEFLATLAALVVGALLFAFFWHHHDAGRPAAHPAGQQATAQQFNKKQYSQSDPASLWVVVNKHRPLSPLDYAPADLVNPNMPLRLNKADGEMQVRAPAAAGLEELNAAASQQGLHLMLASGYRSYPLQVSVYNSEVRANGQAGADQESARPGYSEHQTGLAADLEPLSRKCEVQTCFADTPEGIWLAANAWKYGFTLRYQQNAKPITGYEYEPWHVRFIGKPLAAELHRTAVPTLEQFFGLPDAPNYQ